METTFIPAEDLKGLEELKTITAILPPLSLFDGPWIAGGAARKLLDGDRLDTGDIDLFFSDGFNQSQGFESALKRHGTEVFRSQYAKTYEVEIGDKTYRVQLITRRGYSSVVAIFRDFDFTVCQVAFDGQQVVATKEAIRDIAAKKLNVSPNGRTTSQNLLTRTIKYIRYGFLPAPGFLQKVTQKCLSSRYCFTPENKNTYDWDKDPQETIDLVGF